MVETENSISSLWENPENSPKQHNLFSHISEQIHFAHLEGEGTEFYTIDQFQNLVRRNRHISRKTKNILLSNFKTQLNTQSNLYHGELMRFEAHAHHMIAGMVASRNQ